MTQPVKLPCTCGYETEYRCRIHPSRPAHKMWWRVWVCHECDAEASSMVRDGLSSQVATLKLLEKQFILCSGCAHEMAFIEAGEREADAFEFTLLTGDKFLGAAMIEVENLLVEYSQNDA